MNSPPRRNMPPASSLNRHTIRPLLESAYFKEKIRIAELRNVRPPRPTLRCKICSKPASCYCTECSKNAAKTEEIFAYCGVRSGRPCFSAHI